MEVKIIKINKKIRSYIEDPNAYKEIYGAEGKKVQIFLNSIIRMEKKKSKQLQGEQYDNFRIIFDVDDEVMSNEFCRVNEIKCYIAFYDKIYMGHVYSFDHDYINDEKENDTLYVQGIRTSVDNFLSKERIHGIGKYLIYAVVKSSKENIIRIIEPLDHMAKILERMGFIASGWYYIYGKKKIEDMDIKITN